MKSHQESAVQDVHRAVEFLDKVRNASAEEKAAVGTDHWDWLERAARTVCLAFPRQGFM